VIALAAGGVLLDAAVQASVIFGQHTIYRLDPTARARLNSAYVATFFIGGAAGSQTASALYHAGGWTAVTTFGAALPTICLLTWLTE
jgi:predicted MFS family arabinose efflux permease